MANGAFVLGARTVLGTSLPLEGLRAANFIRRLVFRIEEFVPLGTRIRRLLTWREVVSGMLRMTHVSEILQILHLHAGIKLSAADHQSIHLAANIAINNQEPDWYEQFLKIYGAKVEVSTSALQEHIVRWAGLTESMKYVQLGSPESVVIVRELPEEVFVREMPAMTSWRREGARTGKGRERA